MSQRIIPLISIAAISMAVCGCDPPKSSQSAQGVIVGKAPGPPAPPPPPPPPPGSVAEETTPVAAPAASPPAIEPTATDPPPSESTTKPFIKLSVGIALPQTLPDGTQVGVSVDYKLLKPDLNSAAKYLWVIKSAKGEIAMEVQIKPQGGNLAGFLPLEIRPGDGPFEARIDEVTTSGSRMKVSNVEPLQ